MTLAALSNCWRTPDSKPSLIGHTIRNRYFVESRIGGGTFGTVYKVVDLDSSHRADGYVCRAMKVIDVADPNPPRIPSPDYVNRRLNQAVREIHYHQLVSAHPNIVTLHEHFFIANREEMFLILDYCAGGDLKSYIVQGRNPFAGDDRRMREIILQICGAVDFIHSKGVFHKDLKPHNILISRDGRKAFLCDFGLAESDTHTDTGRGGSMAYMSPGAEFHFMNSACPLTRVAELLDKRGFYCPRRADTWALGISILNMIGLWPWDGATIRSRQFRNFMLGDSHLLRTRPISPEATNLIRDILRFHPELRLSVPEIAARVLQLHSFFDNPCIESTAAELWEMSSTHRHMLTRRDPIARRRGQLEYLRGLDETSAFNDLSGRLPLPPPLPRIHVSDFPQNPPRANRPHCTPILGIPQPVTIPPPPGLPSVSNKRWHMDKLKLAGSWYYP